MSDFGWLVVGCVGVVWAFVALAWIVFKDDRSDFDKWSDKR